MPIHAPGERSPGQKWACFNSCLTFTILLACPIPERKLLEHEQRGEITGMGPTSIFRTVFVSFDCNQRMEVKLGHFLVGRQYSEPARESLRAWGKPILHLFRLSTGMWRAAVSLGCGRKCISLQELFVWRMCCRSWGKRGFCVSTEVAGTDLRTWGNSQRFNSCLKQVKNETGDKTA